MAVIEVVFGESEAGAMKIAANRSKVLGDVIYLPLMLDIGDISKPILGEYRKNLIYKMLYLEQWGADKKMKTELKALGNKYAKQFRRLNGYLSESEPLRVWYSDTPYSICGLMWLCSRLRRYKGELWTIKLPHFVVRNEGTPDEYGCFRYDWGDVEPDEFEELLPLQRRLSGIEVIMNGVSWDVLETENAPLRAVVNGEVISVPANFYDFLIFKYLDDTPVQEAVLIGRILGENPLGISDLWYARRIDELIAKKRVIIIENSPKKYERIIAKAKP